ncbi:MAG: hypothetical protein SF182_30430 [Deltaproteobacteria bacterium]|nr:hypothetical protein [Deltaproteobacteria bacterium]
MARRLAIGAMLLTAAATRAAEVTPADAARFSISRGGPPPPAVVFTLIDPSLTLLPPEALLAVRAMTLEVEAEREGSASTPTPVVERDLNWKLGYRHSQLSDLMTNQTLRSDPSTGYSRQLDRDIVDLGLSWRLTGSDRVGLGYQLQSARNGGPGDVSLSRFLPGSARATHAFTLGVTREFGGAAAPPPPVVAPPLVPLPEVTPAGP